MFLKIGNSRQIKVKFVCLLRPLYTVIVVFLKTLTSKN